MSGGVNFVVADTDATQRNAGWAGQIFDVHMIDLLVRISFWQRIYTTLYGFFVCFSSRIMMEI
jgi:hypothetical protein